MNKLTIFTNPLNANSRLDFDLAPGVTLIDFLQEKYPEGFGGYIRVFIGSTEIELDDLDQDLGDETHAVILVMPTGVLEGALLTAVISAVVGLAVGFIINLLFPPEKPGGLRGGDVDPVYSIGATQNAARPGEPIPAVYGTCYWPPDYAAAPYLFFAEESNDQFVDELLCLGVGNYEIERVDIGNTPVSIMAPGTARWWLFGPDDHLSQLGNIEDFIWNDVKDGATPYRFYENVYSSPEVENWEFVSETSEVVSSPAAISGSVFEGAYEPEVNVFFPGVIRFAPLVDVIEGRPTVQVGDIMTLSNTSNNNVTFTVGSVVLEPTDPTKVKIFERVDDVTGKLKSEQPLAGGATYTINTVTSGMFAGPYRAQKDGQLINQALVDIVFPRGLYNVASDGDIRRQRVEMRFIFQQFDPDTNALIGSPIVQERLFWEKSRQPLRYSVSSGTIPPGAYEVSVERITPISNDANDVQNVVWAGLKGVIVHDNTKPSYGPVTLMALRMKATNGLGQAARTRVRVKARRILANGESDNPITIIKDIYTDPDTGLGRDENELYLAEINPLEIEWGKPNYNVKFNGVFTQRSTALEAMEIVASFAASKLVADGPLITVIPDRIRDVRNALFTSANIVRDSLEINYTFDPSGDFDGVKVEYRDPDNFEPRFVTFPPDAANPDTQVVFGCTDETYAQQMAVYYWNNLNLRRKVATFSTELEGLIPRFADRIGISHPLADWAYSGVVVDVESQQLIRVDQALPFAGGGQDIITFRRDNGTPVDPVACEAVPGDPYMVRLIGVSQVTIKSHRKREPSLYVFGQTYNFIRDFMVERIKPQDEYRIQVEAQAYDSNLYRGAPPHMGDLTNYACDSFDLHILGDPDSFGYYDHTQNETVPVSSQIGGAPAMSWDGTAIGDPPRFDVYSTIPANAYPPDICNALVAKVANQGALSKAYSVVVDVADNIKNVGALMRVTNAEPAADGGSIVMEASTSPGLATPLARLIVTAEGTHTLDVAQASGPSLQFDVNAALNEFFGKFTVYSLSLNLAAKTAKVQVGGQVTELGIGDPPAPPTQIRYSIGSSSIVQTQTGYQLVRSWIGTENNVPQTLWASFLSNFT